MASEAVHSRPQQPTGSPVASLPTETLSQILALAMDGPRAALVLHPFSLVCKHWYDVASAAGLEQDLFVANSKQAGRLAEVLLESSAERQEAIQSLIVDVEKGPKKKQGGRSQHVADLLLSCPNLKRLTLTIAEPLGSSQSGWVPFGKPLALALQALDTLEGFELSNPPALSVDVSIMYPILSGMINLRSFLTAPTTSFYATWNPLGHLLTADQLESIAVSNSDLDLANALTQASSATITTILAGPVNRYQLESNSGQFGARTKSMSQLLSQVASQLIELELLDAHQGFGTFSNHLASIVRKLSSIRRLTLGFHGIDPAGRFPLFSTLKTLEHLTLVSNRETPVVANLIHHQAVLDFLTESSKLKSLTLPRPHCRSWDDASRKLVEKAAEGGGIAFKLV